MSKSFCVSITTCKKDGDKATVGFVVANAALGSEKDLADAWYLWVITNPIRVVP